MSIDLNANHNSNSFEGNSNSNGSRDSAAYRGNAKHSHRGGNETHMSNHDSSNEKQAAADSAVNAEIEEAVRTILRALGEDPQRDGLLETPRRVAKMYREMFRGLSSEPAKHLEKTFDVEGGEIVLIRDIEFTSMCEHHLLPFSGHAHVAYIPRDRVAGLSKFARVVEDVSRRPQVQERMTNQIADMVSETLQSTGVAVVIQAEHSCMAIRGIRKKGSTTVTSALRGVFKTDIGSRAEVMSLITNT